MVGTMTVYKTKARKQVDKEDDKEQVELSLVTEELRSGPHFWCRGMPGVVCAL